jgi:hypothetical protein
VDDKTGTLLFYSHDTMASLSPEEIEFTNAFNANRLVLGGFVTCGNKEELDIIRDGWYLALAADLCPDEYEPVRLHVLADETVSAAYQTASSFQCTVESSTKSEHWETLVGALKEKAMAVGTDLENMWMGLETGRLEWLAAASGAHGIKVTLKESLEKDKEHTVGDVSDAKMVWIYSLAINIPELADAAADWQKRVELPEKTTPLVGYTAELWDPRKEEWAPLDLGVQAAAERGGSSIDQAWEL